jgi:hypothetical protein
MKTHIRKLLFLILCILFVAPLAKANDNPKGEASVNLGWTFSDGVTGDNILAPDGNIYNSIDPKDSFAWGFTGEFFITHNAEVGFRFNRQQSKLEVGGTTTREIGDMNVDDYHGIFSYNFGASDAVMRPFVLGGVGATHYGTVNFTFNGVDHDILGLTKFSTTWGGGLKLRASSFEPRSTSEFGWKPIGPRLISRTIRQDGGAILSGDATWSAVRNTQISLESVAESISNSKE